MEIQGFGWIRDLPDHRDHRYAAPPALTAAPPDHVDLRAGFPSPYDQGALGSCTANAIAGALQFLERKEGAPDPIMPSRLFIYFNERTREGTAEFDSGAQIRDGIKSVAGEGYCPEAEWPYQIDRFAERPPDRCYEDALKERVTSYQRIDQGLDAMLACLATGYPFVFGFTVYESFESDAVRQSGVASLPAPGERVVGGHAVVACGYDRQAQTFWVRNSWGPGWGQEGYFTMPFAYLADPNLAADFWTLRQVPV